MDKRFSVLLVALSLVCCIPFISGDGDYCGAGFISASGRNWTFLSTSNSLNESGTPYIYFLNVCDQQVDKCGGDSALCQEDTSPNIVNRFVSIGSQLYSQLTDLSDTVLQIQYSNGTFCPAYGVNRTVTVYFLCQPISDGAVNASLLNVTEDAIAKCVYTAYVNVPASQCALAGTITTTSATVSTSGSSSSSSSSTSSSSSSTSSSSSSTSGSSTSSSTTSTSSSTGSSSSTTAARSTSTTTANQTTGATTTTSASISLSPSFFVGILSVALFALVH